MTSADGEQSTETSQQVPEVLEELVPVASNEASTSPLALPLEDSATSSHQDSLAEDTSPPGITETSIVEQSSVTDSTAEGLSELIVTGNSIIMSEITGHYCCWHMSTALLFGRLNSIRMQML